MYNCSINMCPPAVGVFCLFFLHGNYFLHTGKRWQNVLSMLVNHNISYAKFNFFLRTLSLYVNVYFRKMLLY